MRIVHKYLLREFITGFFLSLLLFVGLFFLGSLFKLADLVIRKNLNIGYALQLLGWGLPSVLSFAIPISSLLGSLLSLGRMHTDNEILILRASGFHFVRFVSPVLIVGLILSLFSFILFSETIPQARYEQRNVLKKMGSLSPQTLFEPGTFINAFKDCLVFVYDVKSNILYNVFIYKNESGRTRTIFAKKANFIVKKDSLKMKLYQGVSDEIDPQNPDRFYKMRFKTMFLTLKLKSSQKINKRPKDMEWQELITKSKKVIPPERIAYVLEMSKRVNMSLWPFVFTFLGVSLSQKIRIRSRSLNFCIGFLISGLFYIFFLLMQGLSIQNKINPWWGLSLPSVLLLIIGTILLFKK